MGSDGAPALDAHHLVGDERAAVAYHLGSDALDDALRVGDEVPAAMEHATRHV